MSNIAKDLFTHAFPSIISTLVHSSLGIPQQIRPDEEEHKHSSNHNFQPNISILPSQSHLQYSIQIIPPVQNDSAYINTMSRSSISSDGVTNNVISNSVITLKVNNSKLTASIPRSSIAPLTSILRHHQSESINKSIAEERDPNSPEETSERIIKSQLNDICFVRGKKKVYKSICVANHKQPTQSGLKVLKITNDSSMFKTFDVGPVIEERSNIIGFVLKDVKSVGGDIFELPCNIIVPIIKRNEELELVTCRFKGKTGLFSSKAFKIVIKKAHKRPRFKTLI